MKPRTKNQALVYRLSQNLPKLTIQQQDFVFEKYLMHIGITTKRKATCMDCGESFSPSLIKRNKAVCPHCSTNLKIEKSKKRTMKQLDYFVLADIVQGFQLFRYFIVQSEHAFGIKRKTYVYEVCQHWIDLNGKREIVSRLHNQSYWSWSDSWTGYLEIRNKEDLRRYDIIHSFVHPDSVIKSEYTKYGIDQNLKGISFLMAIQKIPNYPKAETLLKAKQISLLQKSMQFEGSIYRFWDSIKICIRNKHIVKDASLFIDYLELLNWFGKDLRSPKYLFPKNLKKEHDRLMDKKRLIQKRQDQELKKKKAIENEAVYQSKKKAFFGLIFQENDLCVKVMESVVDFVTEGDLLHHCIYTNEYFKKDESLILSARKNDEVLETIEVSLTKMEVVQARGKHNQPTQYNSDFIRIVQNNMDKIAEIYERQKLLQA